jgi:hypothetical protein
MEWITVIAGEKVLLVLSIESVALDTKAQRDQEALLKEYLEIQNLLEVK